MKAKVVESGGGGALGGVRGDGKVQKSSSSSRHHQHHHQSSHGHHKVEENQEIKAYLNKLQELVPFMPKNRKLTKLEVITHVIDYIRDLRQTLGLPPCISDGTPFDMQSAMIMSQAANNASNNSSSSSPSPITSLTTSSHYHHSHPHHHHHHQRQPLCPISNTNGNTNCLSSVAPEMFAAELMDKSPSTDDVDTRPVSC